MRRPAWWTPIHSEVARAIALGTLFGAITGILVELTRG